MMSKITRVLAVPAVGAYYYEDLAALQAKPLPVGDRYTADAVTPGFRKVREVVEAVSVGIVLEDGRVAWGDCVSVAYGGKAGREPVFRSEDGVASIQNAVAPWLRGRPLTSFRELARELDQLVETVVEMRPLPKGEADKLTRRQLLTAPMRLFTGDGEAGKPAGPLERVTRQRQLPGAVRYGVSQALLQGVAMARNVTMAEVIAEEWDLPRPAEGVPIHAQTGSERMPGAEKMIVRRIPSLPHAVIDDIPEQLGDNGAKLAQYARWLKSRIVQLAGQEYRPTIHLDTQGTLGQISEGNLGKVLGHLYSLELAVAPYLLRIESPVVMESRQAQIEAMRKLRDYVGFRKMKVQLVADEWANTLEDIQAFIEAKAADMIHIKMPELGSLHNSVEAVLACKAGEVAAFLGGSCAETDISARAAVHVALATQPALIMARPGMGVDEAIMLTQNEMARALAQIGAKTSEASETSEV